MQTLRYPFSCPANADGHRKRRMVALCQEARYLLFKVQYHDFLRISADQGQQFLRQAPGRGVFPMCIAHIVAQIVMDVEHAWDGGGIGCVSHR
jgi:hypothetical protein